MRKISKEMQKAVANAISTGKNWGGGNATIIVEGVSMKVYLHGNYIFRCNVKTKKAEWSDAGWPTRTTCARLNDCFAGIKSKTFIRRKKVNGKWIMVEDSFDKKNKHAHK